MSDSAPRPRPWLTLTMGFLLILGITYWLAGDHVITYGRSVIAAHYAGKAQEKIKNKQWLEASQLLARARSWRGNEPQVLRGYADLLIATRSDNLSLLQILRNLEAVHEITAQDRVYIGQILISLGHVAEARVAYEKLSDAQKLEQKSLELLASIYQAEGRIEDAEKTMRQALAMAPTDPASKLRLAILNHQNTFVEIQDQSRREIWELAESPDDIGLQALEFLSTRARLDGQEADRVMQLIEKHPNNTPGMRYSALSARIRARPQDRDKVIEAEVLRVKGQGVEILRPALTWLLQEQQPERVLELLSGDIHLKSGPLLHSYLLALGALNRWSDIEMILKKKLPVSETFVHLWKARTAEKLDTGIRTVRHHLEAAFAQTLGGQDESSARMTAEAAEEMGQWDLASRFYNDIASLHPLSRGLMLEKVQTMATRGRSTEAALLAADRLTELHPDNQVYKQRTLYLRLIAGHEIETASVAVSQLSNTEKNSPVILLQALAAYRLGDITQVRTFLENLDVKTDFSPGQNAVHAGLRSICGETAQAYRLAEPIPSIMLLPEELRFLQKAL